MAISQIHLTACGLAAPTYHINPGSGEPFATIDLGLVVLFMGDPTELRRLADVCANAADVLTEAQAQTKAAL